MKKLAGKVALVTGGGRGIGAATARALAAEGADVAITYSASAAKAEALAEELSASGVRAAAFHADQADEEQVRSVVALVREKFGRLDILVNNAGVAVMARVDDPEADSAGRRRQLAVNLNGVAAAVQAAAPLLSEGGRIISIGSTLGRRVPFAGLADYAATKAAVVGYTRGWARDLGARNITVNAIQPGPIDTDMNPAGGPYQEYVRSATALGRYGKPEEVASVVTFLAGPDASYITGATLDVDGGQNA